jgi:hypothetical protein
MITLSLRSAERSRTLIVVFGVVALLSCLPISRAQGQRRGVARTEDEMPAFHEYRGIQLGATVDEVRKKLGTPKNESDEQDFYVFNEQESAQIVYDKSHKVITISADFLSGGNGAPTAKDVFGADLEPKADGSMYKMVRYAKAGCWISYNRTAGNSPLTSITVQKILQ